MHRLSCLRIPLSVRSSDRGADGEDCEVIWVLSVDKTSQVIPLRKPGIGYTISRSVSGKYEKREEKAHHLRILRRISRMEPDLPEREAFLETLCDDRTGCGRDRDARGV